MTAQKKTTKKTSTRSASAGEEGSAAKELRDSAHKIWLAGLGAMATAEDEGQRFFKRLVERGEDYETRGRERFEDAKGRAEERFERVTERIGSTVEEQVNRTLERLGVPSREEIKDLSRKIDSLASKIDKLADKQASATGPGPVSTETGPKQ
ncbi:MAG TPA: phasin family protein [Thermoanaerobaculia bacterium]|nr:phasin family protein [Thermoanaerobaculia bacterium]